MTVYTTCPVSLQRRPRRPLVELATSRSYVRSTRCATTQRPTVGPIPLVIDPLPSPSPILTSLPLPSALPFPCPARVSSLFVHPVYDPRFTGLCSYRVRGTDGSYAKL